MKCCTRALHKVASQQGHEGETQHKSQVEADELCTGRGLAGCRSSVVQVLFTYYSGGYGIADSCVGVRVCVREGRDARHP